jgi:HSP20 family protein
MSTWVLAGHESADLADWVGSPMSTLHPLAEVVHAIPFEERAEKNRYVVRFELPGIDPARDLKVMLGEHGLTVRAERSAGTAATQPSGFAHGTVRSAVALPPQANDRDLAAVYRNGILEVNIGWQDGPDIRTVEVLHLSDAW